MPDVRHHLLPRAPRIPDYRTSTVRPIWRGRTHALAALVFLPLLVGLLAGAPPGARWTLAVYAVSLLTCLSVSAAYHILARTPATQLVMQRIDRAVIYLLIAGTYTPVLPLITSPPATYWLLGLVWVGALVGILLRSVGVMNKTSTGLYLAIGWVGLTTAPALWHTSPSAFTLILLGGIAYTTGVVVYATKRPTLSSTHFGYHEVFHALTLIGMLSQFAAIWVLTTNPT